MQAGEFLNDLVMFDQTSLNWSMPFGANTSSTPEGRYDHGMAYLDDQIYIFGGWGKAGMTDLLMMFLCKFLTRSFNAEAGFLRDLRRFNLTSQVWENISQRISGSPPPASKGHRLAVVGKKVFVFGGYCETGQNIVLSSPVSTSCMNSP